MNEAYGRKRLIYLDSAATSLLKPPQVGQAMLRAMRSMASPGRGGHIPAMLAAETAFQCRSEAAALLGVGEPERVVFTMNATHGLNIALHDLVRPGDRVVITGYEHNSVVRMLQLLGAEMDVVRSPLFCAEDAVERWRQKLPGAKAAVVNHVSNVFGYIQPLEEIAALCRACEVPLLVDASQSAGCLPLDFDALGASFAAMPGHKGLLGPQGTGLLLCRDSARPLMAGGTGSESRSREMPLHLPDRLEAGTHNIPGIAGLLEGIRWLRRRSTDRVLAHEQSLTRRMVGALQGIPRLELFADPQGRNQAGVLSFRVAGADCEALAAQLGAMGIALRAGLHCAPLAHESAGTLDSGTLRVSFSPFNTPAEVALAAKKVEELCKKI